MLFRQYYSHITTDSHASIHHVYYFQTRLSTPDEELIPNQKRRKPISSSFFGPDLISVSSNVTVIQPAHSAMMYVALNLHSTFHGSANVSDIDLRSKVLKRMHIKHVTLCPQRSGVSLESSANDIHVAYPTSPTFSALESCLSGHREKFQQDLTHHLLLGGYTDLKRTSGEVVAGEQS